MYIPFQNRETDEKTLLQFMRKHSFATLVSCGTGAPVATHLPFVVHASSEGITLLSHLAKANPHWKYLEQGESLVIFHGPDAYISPTHYERHDAVPTWNYAAVHAYGRCETLDATEYESLLRTMINEFEPAYEAHFDALSEKYRSGLMGGIVCFKVAVTGLEGKFKLSQDKLPTEQARICEHYIQSGDSAEREMAAMMQTNLRNE